MSQKQKAHKSEEKSSVERSIETIINKHYLDWLKETKDRFMVDSINEARKRAKAMLYIARMEITEKHGKRRNYHSNDLEILIGTKLHIAYNKSERHIKKLFPKSWIP